MGARITIEEIEPVDFVSSGTRLVVSAKNPVELKLKDDELQTVIYLAIVTNHMCPQGALGLDLKFEHQAEPDECGVGFFRDLKEMAKKVEGTTYIQRVPDDFDKPVFQVEEVDLEKGTVTIIPDKNTDVA